MKPSNLLAMFILGIAFLQTGCSKEKIEERLLTDEMKSQNPYHEYDKLYFVSDSKQEFVLQVSYKSNEIIDYQSQNGGINYLVEEENTVVTPLDTTQKWGIYLGMDGWDRPPTFEIRFYTPVKNVSEVITTFHFDLPLSVVSPEYVDSVYVNNKWHYNVFIEEEEKTESNAYRIYYSIELGIIKIDFSDESTWELEKIE